MNDDSDNSRFMRIVAMQENPHSERGQYWLANWNEFEIAECQRDIDDHETNINYHKEQLVSARARLRTLHARALTRTITG